MTSTFPWRHVARALIAVGFAALVSTAGQAEERKGFSAGIVLEAEATAKSIGLPIMPGAVRREKEKDEDHALTFALWGGDFGFKVVVLGLSTTAQAGDVVDYYKNAMSRYGSVLDCNGELRKTRKNGEKKKELVCDDKEKPGRQVLKVGTSQNFRLVQIDSSGSQVNINMVRVVTTSE
jgi:hypothetical protein